MKPIRITAAPPISRAPEGADEPARAPPRRFRNNFIDFLAEIAPFLDRLIPRV
jgi:hypothetical protein